MDEMSALLWSLQKLISLCMAEAWGVAHLTFEDESVPYILANLGQLSTWGPPGFGLWLMYVHYLSWECCYQNSVFHAYSCAGTVVGSCTHNHTTYSVCFHDSQYICFNPICHSQEQWLRSL
jgi:hypothetical protein